MYSEKELKAQHRRLRPQFKSVWEQLTPGFEDNEEYRSIRESLVRVNEVVRGLKEDSKGDFFNKLGDNSLSYTFPLKWYSTYNVETAEQLLLFFIERKDEEKDSLELFSHIVGKTNDFSLISELYEECIENKYGYISKNNLFYAIKELLKYGFNVSDSKHLNILRELVKKVYFKHLIYGFKKVLSNELDLSVLEERLYNNESYLSCYDKDKGQGYHSVSHYEPYDIDKEDKLYLETLFTEDDSTYLILSDFIQVSKYIVRKKKDYSYGSFFGCSEKVNIEEEIENDYKEFLFYPLYNAFKEKRLVNLNDLKMAFEKSDVVDYVREDRKEVIYKAGLRKLESQENSKGVGNAILTISDIVKSVDKIVFTDAELQSFVDDINSQFEAKYPSRRKAKIDLDNAIKMIELSKKQAKEKAELLTEIISYEEAVKKYDDYISRNLRGVSIILTTDLTKYSSILKLGAKGKIRNIYERKYYIDFEEGSYNREIYDSGFAIIDAEYLAVKEIVNRNK